MAHDIATINGKAAVALARQPAWHGLGTVVDHLMKAEEAFKAAQLDWQVEKRNLFGQLPDGTFIKLGAFGIFRQTDNQLLGTCGKMYKPIQNYQGFEIIDALLELADDGAYYETAGALGKGEQIWAMARIPNDFTIAGEDEHRTFLLFHTRHDGNGSALCKLVDERVVCANTLAIGLRESGSELRIPHFGNVEAKIEAAKKLMAATGEAVMRLHEKFDVLANRIVTKAHFMAVVDKLFPESEENVEAGVVANARAERIAAVAELFASNDRNAVPAVKGTAYNLLNAVTEYTDHYSGTDKSRARSAMFGAGELVKANALEIILEETQNAATVARPIYSRPASTPMLDAIVEASASVN
jgi:phage/plasmid-like protein (TIGR03299 family)